MLLLMVVYWDAVGRARAKAARAAGSDGSGRAFMMGSSYRVDVRAEDPVDS